MNFQFKELAYLLRVLINPNLEFQYKARPKNYPKQTKPSIQLAR